MPASLRQAVCRLAAAAGDARTDAGLVADFLRRADQAAFAELVRRHGPMVLGVCRRFLGPTPDTADAFQATFLVLIRRARRTDWRESLGPWLHGVALRVARKARAARSRRLASERQVSPMTPEPATPAREPDDLAAVLDEELAALPEVYRRPLVLCELQGASRKDAARELGLAEGTLSSRLARGRRMLRDRLARRGVAPAAAGLATAVPAGLAAATARNAVAVLNRTAGAVPAAILSLTEGVVKAMVVKWKLAAVMVAACVSLTGLGVWRDSPGPAAAAADPPTATAPAVPPPAIPKPVALDFRSPDTHRDGSGAMAVLEFERPVATIFGDVTLTERQFAAHLMRKYGKQELQLFVNKQIIAHAFEKKGLTLSEDDVRAEFDTDLKALGVNRDQFEKDVLPRYGKTMVEWVDEVVTPRLMLSRLCKTKIPAPGEDELRRAFDAKYGEKVQCQVIAWPKDQGDEARRVYEKLRADPAAFKAYARQQADPNLAATAGLVPAASRTPPPGQDCSEAYLVAAKLKAGELSQLVATRDGFLLVSCSGVTPADKSRSFDAEKPVLLAEVVQAKVNREIPKLMDELKREANPKYHLTFPDAAPKK